MLFRSIQRIVLDGLGFIQFGHDVNILTGFMPSRLDGVVGAGGFQKTEQHSDTGSDADQEDELRAFHIQMVAQN